MQQRRSRANSYLVLIRLSRGPKGGHLMAAVAVVHLIEDDDAVRHALISMLSMAGFAVRGYSSACSFLDALPHIQPGCVVSDIRMPDIDGLELQRRLNALPVNLPIILMTGHGDVRLAVDAMKGHAVDFIEKPFETDVLLAAIRIALERRDLTASRISSDAETRYRLANLSPRERQVLDGIVAGKPNRIIAFELGLSVRTIEVHRAHMMTKAGVSSLADLTRRMADLAHGAAWPPCA
jgi:two-component system response regulator FixJ